ncbi:hypothetical protein [Novacetimonas hansenii]|uniref:hypothetical protein n=1 Tax=Novacetimonas hansenii TaxID=436 RepID=UPI0007918447|nr:hypothetical protein [Novacetimonas hansenii]RFP04374.1 hypothetical protein BGC30_03985 [Novacetimonas hansenii]WEQ58224.1 hypothetical protein LV563_10125 [Novacetimonas hansenii]CUW48638.1 hypothetical protein ATCC53582_02779 [Novacetimonas hansenii]
MQFRLLDNKTRPKWEISRWTYSPEKKRAIKETLGSFPCYFSMVSGDILDKCTTQEKAEVLEWWRVTSEAVNRERVRRQITTLPSIFQDLGTLLDVIQDNPEDLAELKQHAYAFKEAVSRVVRKKSRQQKNQGTVNSVPA